MARGAERTKSIKHVPLPASKKVLPDAIKTICTKCDYAIVKFREGDEAYRAEEQLVEFKVVNTGLLNSQVHVHLRLDGHDKRSKPQKKRTVDVDFYLPIQDFKRVAKLLNNVRFKADKYGARRASIKGMKLKASRPIVQGA